METENTLYHLIDARHGRFLVNPLDIYIGRALMEYGEYSELEWQVLEQLTPEHGVVVEVGANIGSHTVALARKVGPRGVVFAYEPQPLVFQNLCANLALNHLTNVNAVNAGCGDVAVEITMPRIDYTKEGNFGAISLENLSQDTPAFSRIPVLRLDDCLNLTGLNLMKIDAEGMEAKILRGASATIAEFRPVIYLENDRLDRSEELIGLVFDLGYNAWWHIPRLFNAENHYGNRKNIFGHTVSINMLCLPKERKSDLQGFEKIRSTHEHPTKRGS